MPVAQRSAGMDPQSLTSCARGACGRCHGLIVAGPRERGNCADLDFVRLSGLVRLSGERVWATFFLIDRRNSIFLRSLRRLVCSRGGELLVR